MFACIYNFACKVVIHVKEMDISCKILSFEQHHPKEILQEGLNGMSRL